MLVAVTGTPGAGKSSVCRVLAGRGYVIVDLDEMARSGGFIVGRDEARQSDEVDVSALREQLDIPAKIAFLKGHYSHLMNVNFAVVLRCRPRVLRERLTSRGWSEGKIRESVDAEAIDVILQEAVERLDFVYEVDTTARSAEESASQILDILQGRTSGHEPGSVDWSDEVLSWY